MCDTASTISANAARYLLERGHLYTVIDAAIKGERPWILPPPPFAGKGCKFGKTASLTFGCLLYLPGASATTPAAAALHRARWPRHDLSPLRTGKTVWEMLRGHSSPGGGLGSTEQYQSTAIQTHLATEGFFFFLEVSWHNRAARNAPRATPPGPHHLWQQDQCLADSCAPSYLSADPASETSGWSHLLMPLPGVGPHAPQAPQVSHLLACSCLSTAAEAAATRSHLLVSHGEMKVFLLSS